LGGEVDLQAGAKKNQQISGTSNLDLQAISKPDSAHADHETLNAAQPQPERVSL